MVGGGGASSAHVSHDTDDLPGRVWEGVEAEPAAHRVTTREVLPGQRRIDHDGQRRGRVVPLGEQPARDEGNPHRPEVVTRDAALDHLGARRRIRFRKSLDPIAERAAPDERDVADRTDDAHARELGRSL